MKVLLVWLKQLMIFSKCKTETLLPCEKWASENTHSLITHIQASSKLYDLSINKIVFVSVCNLLASSYPPAFHHSYNVITMFIYFLYNEISKMGHHQKNLLFFSDLNQKPFFVLLKTWASLRRTKFNFYFLSDFSQMQLHFFPNHYFQPCLRLTKKNLEYELQHVIILDNWREWMERNTGCCCDQVIYGNVYQK